MLSSERLIEELWGDSPPETSRAALQVYIAGLRKALGKDGGSLRTSAVEEHQKLGRAAWKDGERPEDERRSGSSGRASASAPASATLAALPTNGGREEHRDAIGVRIRVDR